MKKKLTAPVKLVYGLMLAPGTLYCLAKPSTSWIRAIMAWNSLSASPRIVRFKFEQIGSNWIKLDQTGSCRIKLEPFESNWVNLNPTSCNWIKLDRLRLDWNNLNPTGSICIKLGQFESNWINLDQTTSNSIKLDQIGSIWIKKIKLDHT